MKKTAFWVKVYIDLKQNKKVIYCKQIARQHSWSTTQKFSSRFVWSPCKIWLLSMILCARRRSQNLGGRRVPAHFWTELGWPQKNTLLLHMCYHTKLRRSRSNRLRVHSVPALTHCINIGQTDGRTDRRANW